ncbi:hydrogenase maturation protease [Streptomyces sp. NPDC005813]|uniref:hydrogenase maturation protease n=1 Tax=Streptomyces sp. NPDC005813 TaxID=3155592 RepID=UPI0033E2AF49
MAFTGSAVVGIGNTFRRDDGVGPAVVALLKERAVTEPLPPGTVLHECDGDPGRLIGLWEGTGLTVIVDACFPSSPRAGRIHRWCPRPGSVAALGSGRHSTHAIGLVETLHLAHSLGRCPRCLLVYAVEGASQSLGTGLTPSVAGAVEPLAERIEADVRRHAEAALRRPSSAPPGSGTRRDTPDGFDTCDADT